MWQKVTNFKEILIFFKKKTDDYLYFYLGISYDVASWKCYLLTYKAGTLVFCQWKGDFLTSKPLSYHCLHTNCTFTVLYPVQESSFQIFLIVWQIRYFWNGHTLRRIVLYSWNVIAWIELCVMLGAVRTGCVRASCSCRYYAKRNSHAHVLKLQ